MLTVASHRKVDVVWCRSRSYRVTRSCLFSDNDDTLSNFEKVNDLIRSFLETGCLFKGVTG
jgi:hypothetical protein